MRVLILGGGISGLSTAWFIRKQDPKTAITLLESQARLGGCIETRRVSDFTFEMGPRTFQRSRSEALLALIRDLGLESELVFSDPAARKRFILHRGKLRSVQSLWPSLLSAGLRDFVMPKGGESEESIEAFAQRRFGKTAAALFFDPLAKGVFAGSIQTLSLDACLPTLRQWELSHRSIIKAMLAQPKQPPGLFTLRGGMSRLIDALAKQPIDIHTNCTVEAIRREGVLANGKWWDADVIVSALPGRELAHLCGIDLALAHEALSVVTMGWRAMPWPKKGYGYLVPSAEQEQLLGQIWDSVVFPTGLHTQVTSMVRGQSPQECALDAMRRHIGTLRDPDAVCVKSAEIPQYELGHARKMNAFEQAVSQLNPKLKLVGNYLQGVSVRDCIQRAQHVATKLCQ